MVLWCRNAVMHADNACYNACRVPPSAYTASAYPWRVTLLPLCYLSVLFGSRFWRRRAALTSAAHAILSSATRTATFSPPHTRACRPFACILLPFTTLYARHPMPHAGHTPHSFCLRPMGSRAFSMQSSFYQARTQTWRVAEDEPGETASIRRDSYLRASYSLCRGTINMQYRAARRYHRFGALAERGLPVSMPPPDLYTCAAFLYLACRTSSTSLAPSLSLCWFAVT